MTRAALIELAKQIISGKGTEQELDALMDLFDKHVPHPDGSNLLFFPEAGEVSPYETGSYHPTVEEVVDKCLAYRPIQL